MREFPRRSQRVKEDRERRAQAGRPYLSRSTGAWCMSDKEATGHQNGPQSSAERPRITAGPEANRIWQTSDKVSSDLFRFEAPFETMQPPAL
jgi:hypothetical protein